MASSEVVQGLLVGMALGESLGRDYTYMRLREIRTRFPNGLSMPDKPLYGAGMQLAVETIEGLLFDSGLSASTDAQMERIAGRYIHWYEHGADRSPDRVVWAGIGNLVQGVGWQQSGLPQGRSSEVLLRVLPIGALLANDEARLYTLVSAVCRVTHGHTAAVAASIAAAYAVALTLSGTHLTDYAARILRFCDGISDDFEYAVLRVGHVLGWSDEDAAMRHIGDGTNADEALALALYCVLRYEDDDMACIQRAASIDGPSHVVAGLAGGLAAMRQGGIQGLPVDSITALENGDYLDEVAARMVDVMTVQ